MPFRARWPVDARRTVPLQNRSNRRALCRTTLRNCCAQLDWILCGAMATAYSIPEVSQNIKVIADSPRQNKDHRPLGEVQPVELRFVISLGLVLCAITTLPYFIGHFVSHPGTEFTGIIEHSADTNNYLGYANQAAQGKWLFRNRMTGEPHADVFFNLEWLLIGKIAACFHVSLPVALGLLRLSCLLVMCLGVYWLSSFVLHDVFARRIALTAIMAGGGFGWIAALHLLHVRIDSSYFLDLTAALQFPFYWALKLPHFLVSETFVVLGLAFFLKAETRNQISDYLFAGVFYLASGSCRPYDMLFLMCATGLYAAISYLSEGRIGSKLVQRSIPVLICLPLLGYEYWIFKIHPVFRWWSMPGLPPPAPWLLALSFGFSFILFVLALFRLRANHLGAPGKFLASCLLTATLFVYTYRYLHFSFQFATNLVVPMVLLALIVFEAGIVRWRKQRPWAGPAVVGLLIVNSFTSLALAGQVSVLAAQGDFRIDRNLLQAYSWLDQHSHADDVVLADFPFSTHLPQYTHTAAFCGYSNTVRYAEKSRAQSEFFQPASSEQMRRDLIAQNGIRFVVLTAEEKAALKIQAAWLSEVFENDAATIYVVSHESR